MTDFFFFTVSLLQIAQMVLQTLKRLLVASHTLSHQVLMVKIRKNVGG